MKKFNLFSEIVIVDRANLQTIVDSNTSFAINSSGEILSAPYKENEIFIFKGDIDSDNKSNLEKVLGKSYNIVVDEERVLIKAFPNWQALIAINTPNSSYDDTTADGVAEFAYKGLEDIGWHATEFNISYRSLVEILEDKCEGTILCIEQLEPYQFSGLGFLSDNKQAESTLFEYCQEKIKHLIENNDDFKKDELEDDQIEAMEFFKL